MNTGLDWKPFRHTLESGIDVGQGILKFNNRRAFNKAVGPGKNPKLINVGPTSTPEARVCNLWQTRRNFF